MHLQLRTQTNEASGTNYTAKGASLTRVDPTHQAQLRTDFADLHFLMLL